jgi:hypothetical protein
MKLFNLRRFVLCSFTPRINYRANWRISLQELRITNAGFIQNRNFLSAFRTYVSAADLIFFLICIVGGGIKVHSTLRPLNGLLCQPRVSMIMEKSVERLAGETEVFGENLPQCSFVHHKPHMLPVREPGPPRWDAADLSKNIYTCYEMYSIFFPCIR